MITPAGVGFASTNASFVNGAPGGNSRFRPPPATTGGGGGRGGGPDGAGRRQVPGDRLQLGVGLRAVDRGDAVLQLVQAEAALSGRHPQAFGDLFALVVRDAQVPRVDRLGDVARHAVDLTRRRAGWERRSGLTKRSRTRR